MFEETTSGEWVVFALSFVGAVIFALGNTTGNFKITALIAIAAIILIPLYIIYWIVTNVYPKSENWGVVSWSALFIIPSVILFLLGSGN